MNRSRQMSATMQMTERQKVEEYLKFYCINEVLDEVINELVETRPLNPFVAMCGMMERHTMPEIVDVIVNPTFVGRGHTGVIATVITNIGQFTGTSAYPYASMADPAGEGGAYDVTRDFSRAQDSLRNALCKLDPRNLSEVDKLIDGMPEIDNTVAIAVSMACCRAGAKHKGLPLYRYLNTIGVKDTEQAQNMARLHMRIPLPVVTLLSRTKAEEGSSALTQDVTAYPTTSATVEGALGVAQNAYRAVLKFMEEKKVLLGFTDSGCPRAVLPSLDDAVRAVKAALEGADGGVMLGLDVRATDFAKVSEVPPPADAPADAPNGPTTKVEYTFPSPAAPPGPVASPAAAAAAAPAAAAAAAPVAKGKKPDPKAAAAAAAAPATEAAPAAGDASEVALNKLFTLWKETEFISVEDPLHVTADLANVRTLKQRVASALADVTSAENADVTRLVYAKGGVGGQDGCLLQVVLDAAAVAPEDVKALAVKGSDKSLNAVKVRLDKVKSVGKAMAICKAVRDAGLALVVGCNESGPETLDPFIADLAVAAGAGQFAAGGVGAGEYFGKYARLIEISKEDPSLPFNSGKTFRR